MEDRKLSLIGITSMALLNVLGTGLFFGPALSARYAGNSSLIVWVYLGIQSIYIGMIFSELASLHPKSGGVYEFAKQAYGHFMSFIVGWVMWLVSTVMIVTLIISALLYAFPGLGEVQMLASALGILILLSLIAYRGLGESEKILDSLAAIILVFIILTLVSGTQHFSLDNLSPFLTATPVMMFAALFFILETYFGWEAVTFMAEETKSPEKTIPKALLISTGIAAFMGLVFSFMLFGIMGADTLSQSTTPLYDVFVLLFGELGGTILRAGVFLSLVGSAAGVVISSPRLLSAMARDRLFIEQFSVRSKRTGTPARAIFFQLVVAGVVLFFSLAEYQLLLSVLVPLAAFMYVATFISLPVLRYRQPGVRTFSCPFPRAGPAFVSLVFAGALAGWLMSDPASLGILSFSASLMFLGVPIYFLLVTYYNPDVIRGLNDKVSWIAYLLENITLPKKVRKDILAIFSDLKEKIILEFGAGVGTLTLHLAEEVGPGGKIYATDFSEKNLRILKKRLARKRYYHVEIIHDEHQVNRVHPSLKQVDLVFSIGMLSYLQDVKKVLKEINQILPKHGKVCFVEYVDFFWFLPNPPWMSDIDKVKKTFREAGFSVYVKKEKGLFWKYLVVYGFKSEEDVPFV